MSETRPCKDCENHGILYQNGIENDIVYMIKCRGCENQTNYYDTSDAAIDAWNHEFGKPKTNREWLESLSDEEFSSNLLCITTNNEMCAYCENGDMTHCRNYSDSMDDCNRAFTKWLKAEHKVISNEQ